MEQLKFAEDHTTSNFLKATLINMFFCGTIKPR